MLRLRISLRRQSFRDPLAFQFVPFAAESSYMVEPAWSPNGRVVAYAAEKDGVGNVANDVADEKGNGEQDQHDARRRRGDLAGEKIGDDISDDQRQSGGFDGDDPPG